MVVLGLAKVQGSAIALALGKTGFDMVEAASDLVTRLTHGSGPKKIDIANFDEYHKLVCKRMGNFFFHSVTNDGGVKKNGSDNSC